MERPEIEIVEGPIGKGDRVDVWTFLVANSDSEEIWEAVRQLAQGLAGGPRYVGETVTVGGGAAPLTTLRWAR